MMWNWLVSALATGASVVLYDGSPLIPSPNVLWDLTDRLGYVPRVVAVAPVTLTQAAPPCVVFSWSGTRAQHDTIYPLAQPWVELLLKICTKTFSERGGETKS